MKYLTVDETIFWEKMYQDSSIMLIIIANNVTVG